MNPKYAAFYQTETSFFSNVSFSKTERSNMVAYATGVQAAGLNPVIVKAIDDQFLENIIQSQEFYSQHKLPWALVIPEYLYTEQLEFLLKEQGLELADQGVAMMISIDDISLPIIDSPLKIREINGDLQTWSIPLIHGFESIPEVAAVYTKRHESASQNNAKLFHFSGFIDNAIVCSLTLSLCDDFARIDDVATLPAHQKQGYASALILDTLRFAQELNITNCFLEASKTGLGVYKKLGFTELFINRHYELPL